ncbi:MAG: response regulator [Anaerolineales bacterium]|nr:response regulator [Anaerolineales bacterium]
MPEKILIIDDDIDTLKLVGLMLERQGYEIVVASNGQMGLTRAATERPALILLDVMMPDLDGYEVTRQLRSDPGLAHIPIIMFTAKTMVDDKVAGFEAGVDDYLTKPAHPAELTAHVKAVLARTQQNPVEQADSAKVIGFIGVRGGVGTTTLALNVSVALQQSGQDVILAEMNPGRGSLALNLNIRDSFGLSTLLTRSLKDIHLRSVESEIASHRSGIRLLLSSYQPEETNLEKAVHQMEAVLKNLMAMSTIVMLDLGTGIRPYTKTMMSLCDHILLVVEPLYPTNVLARALLEDLESKGINRHRISLAMMTRERTSMMISWQELAGDLGIELAGVISPAPEQAQEATQAGKPIIQVHPESLVSDQLIQLSNYVMKFVEPNSQD